MSDGDVDRPAAEARRERALRALDVLIEVAVRSAAAERIAPPAGDATLHLLAEAAAAAVRVTALSIALHDPVADRLVFRAAAGPQGAGVVGLSIDAHDGIAGYVLSSGQALAVAEATTDPRFERSTAERTGYLPTSLLAVPLVDGAGIVGVMELLDRRDGAPFDLADVELATRMAAAATAIVRATRLDREVGTVLQSVLSTIGDAGGAGLDAADLEALLAEIGDRLSIEDGLWRLADRIGRLRTADPDDLDLIVAWLDALLARSGRRTLSGRRTGV